MNVPMDDGNFFFVDGKRKHPNESLHTQYLKPAFKMNKSQNNVKSIIIGKMLTTNVLGQLIIHLTSTRLQMV